MPEPTWVVMVVAGAQEYTDAAISDVLAQSVPTRLLLVGQGLDREYRQHLERIAEAHEERVFCWWFAPALPSLSAAWNRALQFVWNCGGHHALVVNNDVRLHPKTVETLEIGLVTQFADFVSAVAVAQEQFDALGAHITPDFKQRGGPDFSCFLISNAGHEKYPFDEGFIPAYCEDLDMHRRYMLGGDGEHIFSVNVPYLHYASGTLKSMTPEARQRKEMAINGSRAHYAAKWGGPVNQERFTIPFDKESAQDGVTTPELQRAGAV